MHSSDTPSPSRSTIVSAPVALPLAVNPGDAIDAACKVTRPAACAHALPAPGTQPLCSRYPSLPSPKEITRVAGRSSMPAGPRGTLHLRLLNHDAARGVIGLWSNQSSSILFGG